MKVFFKYNLMTIFLGFYDFFRLIVFYVNTIQKIVSYPFLHQFEILGSNKFKISSVCQ